MWEPSRDFRAKRVARLRTVRRQEIVFEREIRLDQLTALINSVLSPKERLGRLALSTQSHDEAERGQFLDIARKLASEMHCNIDIEDLPDEYTVWLYGSRHQIGALMRELAPGG